MKCQIPFSDKNKKKYFNMSSAEKFTQSLRVRIHASCHAKQGLNRIRDKSPYQPARPCSLSRPSLSAYTFISIRTVFMKCQTLFSGKKKKEIFYLFVLREK